jgi:CysZ protein
MLDPILRAVAQLDDRAFLSTVLHSVLWSTLAFVLLGAGLAWGGHDLAARIAADPGWLGWLSWAASLLGVVGAALATLVLFVPLATAIALMFSDRIAAAVEHRYYPALPDAAPAHLAAQAWDGVALGLRVLGMQLLALLLSLLLPGIGVLLGWLVAAWAMGRGLFVAVAMRRMPRAAAVALYRRRRMAVLAQGGLMVAGALVPVLNLVTPVLGVAALVHVLHAPVGRAPGAEAVLAPRRHS